MASGAQAKFLSSYLAPSRPLMIRASLDTLSPGHWLLNLREYVGLAYEPLIYIESVRSVVTDEVGARRKWSQQQLLDNHGGATVSVGGIPCTPPPTIQALADLR